MKNELQERMERLYRQQQKCFKFQILLGVLASMFSQNENGYGVILLFGLAAMVIICGVIFSNKATSLALKKYPYVLTWPPGKGYSYDSYIIHEARCSNDPLTVQILKYPFRAMGILGITMLGYVPIGKFVYSLFHPIAK